MKTVVNSGVLLLQYYKIIFVDLYVILHYDQSRLKLSVVTSGLERVENAPIKFIANGLINTE